MLLTKAIASKAENEVSSYWTGKKISSTRLCSPPVLQIHSVLQHLLPYYCGSGDGEWGEAKIIPSLIFTFNKNIVRGDNTPFASACVSAYVSDCCIFGVPLFVIGTPCFCRWVRVLEVPSHRSLLIARQP